MWEAAIKQAKHHLKRIIGDANVTYEEMSTLLTQIEACLNSRPLCPVSEDPLDNFILTPAHFLIQDTLTAIPEPDLQQHKVSKLSRWQYIQRLTQQFWKKWSQQYLNELQKRVKWRTKSRNLKIGDVVILKDDNLPPLKWSIGRITEVHPGSDHIVRAVTVQTSTGITKRASTRVCLLPNEDEDQHR